jgi:lipopolysaccharide export LptBFGC system permease protein LptF
MGIGMSPGLAAQLFFSSLPSLVVFALPLTLAIAILFTYGRLSATNELLAMRLQGASPLQLALPAMSAGVIALFITWLMAAYLEMPALQHLQRTIVGRAAQMLILNMQHRQFHSLFKQKTLYLDKPLSSKKEKQRQVHASGIFIAQKNPRIILVAEGATFSLQQNGQVNIGLVTGELHQFSPQARIQRRIRFHGLQQTLSLNQVIEPHLRFLSQWADNTRRRYAAPSACLALTLLATVVGLGKGNRWRITLKGLLAIVTFQCVFSAAGWFAPQSGKVFVSGISILLSFTWLLWTSQPRGEKT